MSIPPPFRPGLLRVRVATLLFPLAGLFLLWRLKGLSRGKKWLGTLGILLFIPLHLAGIIALLLWGGNLEIEWQGGFPPVLTRHKTRPDYDALEASRRKAVLPLKITNEVQFAPAYWTGFRGPQRDGHYQEMPVRTDWPADGLKPLWKQLCGAGYASFCVAEGRAYTIEQRREQEVIVAYDVNDGRELWTNAYNARFDEPLGGEGPRSTPAYADGRIYSLGALGNFFCTDAATGRTLWQKQVLGQHHTTIPVYGFASSPLIVDDLVLIMTGGTGNQNVVAYDRVSGAVRWHQLGDEISYSSPALVELAGRRQILAVTKSRAAGLDVADGTVLWEFPWQVKMNQPFCSQPLVLSSNRFLLSAGYSTGCAAVEVTHSGGKFSAREVWKNSFLKNKFASSVLHEDYIYGQDEEMLTCLNARTGERVWKDGRYGYGQLVLASGHLVILTGSGELALVKATPQGHQELARFPALDGKTWNHPALADGRLFVRNLVEMACFDLRPAAP